MRPYRSHPRRCCFCNRKDCIQPSVPRIVNVALFFSQNQSAHDLPFLEAEKIIEAVSSSDNESSFYESKLIRKKLVDYYVPFFPMPEEEVECCVRLELEANTTFKQRDVMERRAIMDKILKNFHFEPAGNPWYVDFGCKSVKKAIALFQ